MQKRIDSYREAMIRMQIGLTAIPALFPVVAATENGKIAVSPQTSGVGFTGHSGDQRS